MTGAELRAMRIEAGLTQRQLGEALGFTGDPGRSVRKMESRLVLGAKEYAHLRVTFGLEA